MEAEWLISAGYPELTRPFEQVSKITKQKLKIKQTQPCLM